MKRFPAGSFSLEILNGRDTVKEALEIEISWRMFHVSTFSSLEALVFWPFSQEWPWFAQENYIRVWCVTFLPNKVWDLWCHCYTTTVRMALGFVPRLAKDGSGFTQESFFFVAGCVTFLPTNVWDLPCLCYAPFARTALGFVPRDVKDLGLGILWNFASDPYEKVSNWILFP